MSTEQPDLAASLRTGCEWIAAALGDLATATEAATGSGSRHEIALALHRLASAQERLAAAAEQQAGALQRQAGALERLAGVMAEGRREK